MADKKQKKINSRTAVYYSIFIALGIVALLVLVDVGYAYAYRGRTLLNSYLLGKNISGENKDQLLSFINQSESNYSDKKIKVAYGDKTYEINYDDFNWQLEKDKTSDQILNTAENNNLFYRGLVYLKSLFMKSEYDLQYSFDEGSLIDWMNGINLEIGTPKEETNIIIKNDEVKITDPKAGEKIDDQALRQEVLDRLALKKSGEIKISLIKDEPVISKDEALKLVDLAKERTNHSVKIIGPQDSIDLDSEFLGRAIQLKKKMRKTGFLKSELGEAYVSFDDKKLKSLLQKNSDTLNVSSQDAEFSISSGNITLTSPSKEGREIKLDDSVVVTVSGLEKGEKEIELPTKVQKPSIDAQSSADIQRIGIKELIGSATTDFSRSPENRIHNIKTGVKYISGAVVKPGGEFSTLSRLGTIDQNSGYLPELVIKENATVPEFGGGLCQVSTTLFRAAMNSGLKITERQNHSYRVSYYEPPVGMDATIYYPRPDFKFINSTDNYILINGHLEGSKITFDIYGTKDGRKVSISNPEVYDITAPPDSIYTDDPTLEPGQEKQIDHAHPGAKASFSYTVYKNDKVINQQTFNSAYVAWPAKFLRGPQSTESQSESPTPTP